MPVVVNCCGSDGAGSGYPPMMQSSMSSSAQLPAAYGLNNSMQASDSALSAAAVCAVDYGRPV